MFSSNSTQSAIWNPFLKLMQGLNRFQISNGKVYFTNKLLETNTYKKSAATNSLIPMFGTADPCSRLFDRFKMVFQKNSKAAVFENDNVNVNVVPFGRDQLYALTETSMVVRLDPNNLNVLSRANLFEYLKPTISTIAHPHVEEDGSWISVGMKPMGKSMAYDIMKFQAKNVNNACESAISIGQIPSSHKFGLSYFHSFGLSQNYIIFLEQSLVLDMKKVLWNTVVNKPISTAINMNKNFKTQIHLLNRKTGQVIEKKFFTDPQFTFHHINAYEINETDPTKHELFIDLCSYSTKDFHLNTFQYDETDEEQVANFTEKSKPTPRRIRVPLYETKAKSENIYCEIKDIATNVSMELPTIHYNKFNAKPYSYAYGIGSIKPPYSIVKVNVNNINDHKQAVIKTNNRVILPSEPIFVEKPDAKEEDDGVILTLVLGDKYDSLVVLDAKTFEEIGRAELPENVKATYTFHGFFSDNKI